MSTLIFPQHYLVFLKALLFLGSPSFIQFAAAANQCFGADDGGDEGILSNAARDYISQDCANNNNCAVAQTYGWPMNSWCVGNVTDMSYLFYYMYPAFNEDISGWDTSSVIHMSNMFQGATSFNQDVSEWDISNVTDMTYMFDGATSFNQDLCAWGDKFPYDNALGIFRNAGCTFQDDPQENQKGPFCASDCNGDTPTPTPSPLVVLFLSPPPNHQALTNTFRFFLLHIGPL